MVVRKQISGNYLSSISSFYDLVGRWFIFTFVNHDNTRGLMKNTILLIFCFFLMGTYSMADDTIVFLSGRITYGIVKEVDSLDIQLEVQKRKKTKLIYIAKNNVFAIKYGDGKTDIFYEPMNAEEFSLREMEFFIKGEQDALKNTKAPLLFVAGVIIGGGSVVLWGPFLGLLPVMPYSLLSGSFTNKVKEKGVSNPDLLREDTYITGYVTKGKNIKIQRAVTGSIVGYVGGLIAIGVNAKINKQN